MSSKDLLKRKNLIPLPSKTTCFHCLGRFLNTRFFGALLGCSRLTIFGGKPPSVLRVRGDDTITIEVHLFHPARGTVEMWPMIWIMNCLKRIPTIFIGPFSIGNTMDLLLILIINLIMQKKIFTLCQLRCEKTHFSLNIHTYIPHISIQQQMTTCIYIYIVSILCSK